MQIKTIAKVVLVIIVSLLITGSHAVAEDADFIEEFIADQDLQVFEEHVEYLQEAVDERGMFPRPLDVMNMLQQKLKIQNLRVEEELDIAEDVLFDIHSTIVYEEMSEEELQSLKDNLMLIDGYFAEQGVEYSREINNLARSSAARQKISVSDFENMLENLLLAYEAGMEVEEADMIARAIPEWENMNLPMLTAAFGEVLAEENGEFETVLEQILERAREITEEVGIE